MIKVLKLLVIAFAIGGLTNAQSVELKPDHPTEYIVQIGDTLWDISAKFLSNPWEWPEIWHVNQQVRNPHLIYPGDKLLLSFKDGKPVIYVDTRGDGEEKGHTPLQVTKMSPRVRPQSLEDPKPNIPTQNVNPFLNHALIVSRRELNGAPYLLSSKDGRLLTGARDIVYVSGIRDKSLTNYRIYRRGKKIKDGIFTLGYIANYIGEAKVIKFGSPSTVVINSTEREAMQGDKLLPLRPSDEFQPAFEPHHPSHSVRGRVVAFYEGIAMVGQYQIVVINRGTKHKIERGHLLTVYKKGNRTGGFFGKRLPDEKAGILMVYKTFKKASYALVMSAVTDIKLYDNVRNP